MREIRHAPFKIFLPATSANLGPAFDAAALAFDFGLHVEAVRADDFSIIATGRDAQICGRLESNLILDTYRNILQKHDRTPAPLAIRIDNEIPLGMGCGSSAAAVLAAIALAVDFGGLEWDSGQIVSAASACEGHPDNVAACWHGGVVLARSSSPNRSGAVPTVRVLPIPTSVQWPLLLAIPDNPLATAEARRVLPALYSRVDLIHNVQGAMMLVLALVQGRGEWLGEALSDRVHHPYRAQLCPLLPVLSELTGTPGIFGVALSGAGPAVLLFLDRNCDREIIRGKVERCLVQSGQHAELRFASISRKGAVDTFLASAKASSCSPTG